MVRFIMKIRLVSRENQGDSSCRVSRKIINPSRHLSRRFASIVMMSEPFPRCGKKIFTRENGRKYEYFTFILTVVVSILMAKPHSKSKENMPNTDDKPNNLDDKSIIDSMPSNFDEMMTGVKQDIERQQVEESIVDRVPELKQLNADIEKATTLLTNALLALEDSIRQYKHEEIVLNGSAITIRKDIETINDSIAKLIEEAPNKLKVSVNVNDADWQKIQEMFDQHHREIEAMMQKQIREVNSMFAEERRNVQKRYKEYDGCYLGHVYIFQSNFYFHFSPRINYFIPKKSLKGFILATNVCFPAVMFGKCFIAIGLLPSKCRTT